jgi:hypothetical protein
MVQNVTCENVVKIGFLNDSLVYDVNNYDVFDAVVMNDGDFCFVNFLIDWVAGKEFDIEKFIDFQWLVNKLNE